MLHYKAIEAVLIIAALAPSIFAAPIEPTSQDSHEVTVNQGNHIRNVVASDIYSRELSDDSEELSTSASTSIQTRGFWGSSSASTTSVAPNATPTKTSFLSKLFPGTKKPTPVAPAPRPVQTKWYQGMFGGTKTPTSPAPAQTSPGFFSRWFSGKKSSTATPPSSAPSPQNHMPPQTAGVYHYSPTSTKDPKNSDDEMYYDAHEGYPNSYTGGPVPGSYTDW